MAEIKLDKAKKALLLAKFFAKERVEGDPDLDALFEMDDFWRKIYEDNRISKGFTAANILASQALIFFIFDNEF